MLGNDGVDAVDDNVDAVGIELIIFNKEGLNVLADRDRAPAPEGERAQMRSGIVKSVRRYGKGREALLLCEHSADKRGDPAVGVNDVEMPLDGKLFDPDSVGADELNHFLTE